MYKSALAIFISKNSKFCSLMEISMPLHHSDGDLPDMFYKNILDDAVQKLKDGEKVLEGYKLKSLNKFFLTVQYDEKIITIEKQKELSLRIYNYKDFKILGAVNEKFRENGITYHTHFCIETKLAKSKVIQFVYQFCKNYIVGLPSVDCRKMETVHLKYVSGDKKPEKMKNVALDRIWRKENAFEF